MPEYRVNTVSNGITQSGQNFDCNTDIEAIDQGRALVKLGEIEIWQGWRLVVALDREAA